MNINPEPAGQGHFIDQEDNPCTLIWFSGLINALNIVAKSEVEVSPFNPFSFVFHPLQCGRMPFEYPGELLPFLQLYKTPAAQSLPVISFMKKIQANSGNGTIDFLTELTRSISDEFEVVIRETGSALPPQKTIHLGQGSCRDLTLLAMETCRSAGLAARFVSGYRYVEEGDDGHDGHELHAWMEVFLPGGGWIGFDPTSGLVATHNYVSLASSYDPSLTLPVIGNFRGRAQSELTSTVDIVAS